MVNKLFRRGRRGFGKAGIAMEMLESRLNMSALPTMGAGLGHVATDVDYKNVPQVTLAAQASFGADSLDSLTFGDTNVGGSGTTTVNITDLAAIQGAKVEWVNGVADIGYMASQWVGLTYNTNISAGGNYNLNFGVAAPYGGTFDVFINGVLGATYSFSGTGSWSNYTTVSKSLYMGSGRDVITILPKTGSQFNLNAMSFTSQSAATAPTTTAPATTAPSGTSNWVDSNGATISADKYSNISNARIEWQNGTPDVGYINWGGYVEYTLNVASAGNYSVGVNTASPAGGSYTMSVNGAGATTYSFGSTGSWNSFQMKYNTVWLNAGSNVIRLATVNGSQYNTGNVVVAPAGTSSPAAPTPTPTPTPAPAPTTPSGSGGVVNVSSGWISSFNELTITGTTGDDNIYVTQSGNTINVSANGRSSSYYGPFGDIVIKGDAGNDTITVDGSVNVASLVYGGDGSNTIRNSTQALATVVTIGGGYNTVQGNGFNSALWVNSGDNVTASWTEQNAGDVHRVSGFWNGVSTSLWGQNLSDPTGTGATTRVNASLWGTGPTMSDVMQGQVADCFVLGPLQTLAMTSSAKLQQLAVDLGDGTYAIQFKRGGNTTYVRVDGDLPSNGYYANGLMYAHPGASGTIWAAIIEKAYAEYRTGGRNYNSLNYGSFGGTLSDFGIGYTSFGSLDPNTMFNTIASSLSRGVTIGTAGWISGGAPLVDTHTYTVTAAWRDANGTGWVTLRNPWGFDGAGSDGNSGDALVTMTINQLQPNVTFGTVQL